MIGIVVVSHSHALAIAAVDLAREMVEVAPPIAVAAGLGDTTFGTDAMAISEAIADVDSPEGVLVLLDLGSAILSTEMALEFVDPEVAERVRVSPAPLVEGLVAAVVTAATGGSLDEVDAEARQGLAGKTEHLGGAGEVVAASAPTDAGALVFTATIRNPHGLHARPAAALVAGLRGVDADVQISNATLGKGPVSARSLTRVATLGLRRGDELVASITGPDAGTALTRLGELASDDFGEVVAPSPAPPRASPPAAARGTGVQIVVGPARVELTTVDTSGYVAGHAVGEREKADQAFSEVRGHLVGLAVASGNADIFEAQAAILGDDDLADGVHEEIRQGLPATTAVERRFTEAASQFDTLADPYLRERGQDVRSLRRLLLLALLGTLAEPPAAGAASVLVTDELDAATASTLDLATTLGVITTTGGATGHGVIVATSRGIPVLTGRPGAATLHDGDPVAFDPLSKQAWLNPTPDQIHDLQVRSRQRSAEAADAAEHAHAPARTRDGRRIVVEANVASLADAVTGLASGAEGSGLVRTELLFGDLAVAPTPQEQADVFVAIGEALGGEMITIRTWDVGGDKPLAFLPQASEANPFLGERGLRTMRRVPDLFADQLRAIVLAGRRTPVRVMFPMVTEPAEVVWAREILASVVRELDAEPIPVGIMVEVPAAAVRASDFVDLIDFASIGTNDLTQYTTATDRGNGVVAHLARADAPAVLDLIAMTCAALAPTPVAVCGDLASDTTMTGTLISLGVSELSVRAPLVGLVKQAVRRA